MKTIDISAEHSYQILFVNQLENSLKDFVGDKEACVLTPESFVSRIGYLPKEWRVIALPDGESQKNGEVYLSVLNQLAQTGISRSAVLIGIGGGATTDLVGFLAATYMRGISWIAVPTSLAGMVDAAIGGKTGINLPSGKNLAGSFHSPLAVLINEEFLSTLPDRDVNAGMAEVIKCGFISDPKILELCESNPLTNRSELIWRAANVKAEVVSKDFKESSLREILNYGHTLGHAIEKHCGYQLRHGEAISIGLVFAAHLSKEKLGLDSAIVEQHSKLLQRFNLPIRYRKDAWDELYRLMQLDKKKTNVGLRFIGLKGVGSVSRIDAVEEDLLKNIYLKVIGE
ncbi:MAG: 3-dehydroquinate synthase [Candidatus Nanopelagicaceae bacterium]|nr:3-dehydroquinate synthase [Candidatus Nanopelagicaceae bacterium]